MTTIHSLLDDYRQNASNNRIMGGEFEQLMQAYLKTDPLYQAQYADVWLWNEWDGRESGDVGIDLVAKKHTGEYTAIQCKFFSPEHSLQKKDIDSFFTESGKAPFNERLIISTTNKWGKNAEAALDKQQIPVARLSVQDLAASPIDWGQFDWKAPQKLTLKPKKQTWSFPPINPSK